MDAIQKEHERLVKKSNLSKPISTVDKIISMLTTARAQISNDPTSSALVLAKLNNQLQTAVSTLNDEQKDIYNGLGKYGKALDKKFKASSSFSSAEYDALAGETSLINRAIAMHLIREGNFDVASTFLHEAEQKGDPLDISEGLTKDFKDLYEILDAMKVRRDLGPAIQWARSKEAQLDARGSNLEFELCRLQYIWYFMGEGKGTGGDKQALEYARKEFGRFQDKYLPEIQKLITAFAFLPTIHTSPYAPLFLDPERMWSDVSRSFTREFCSLLGLSAESPLYIAATAGAIALPTLLKMTSIMKEKKTEWSSVNELPVEIPLPPRYQFHSIFVCPVSKDQTTETNPPMMLPCGHVIAHESLQRLAKGGTQVTLKCPYCPKECTAQQAKRVYL
ncbi:CTLH/CRA C-terminal to lish motif domain-containing protein [Kalaharituber pfeilii]|nr:CTLH/CRA C-terminal to lish motif domain-containing protein [Kalaharituber pfeilii]